MLVREEPPAIAKNRQRNRGRQPTEADYEKTTAGVTAGVSPSMPVFGSRFSGPRFDASRSSPENPAKSIKIYIYIYIYRYIAAHVGSPGAASTSPGVTLPLVGRGICASRLSRVGISSWLHPRRHCFWWDLRRARHSRPCRAYPEESATRTQSRLSSRPGESTGDSAHGFTSCS